MADKRRAMIEYLLDKNNNCICGVYVGRDNEYGVIMDCRGDGWGKRKWKGEENIESGEFDN